MIGVDGSVLIDFLRGKSFADKLQRYSEVSLCTSEIVVYEILYGLYASNQFSDKKVKEFEAVLDAFDYVFPVERNASIIAAKIAGRLSKQGQTIRHSDALIAGTLLANGCKRFMTKNIKDFVRIKELEIVDVGL